LASTKAVPVVQSLRFVQIVQAVVGVDSARLFDREKGLLRKNRCHEQAVTFCQGTSGTSFNLDGSQFQTFKWFDGLTMSGFILSRYAEPALSSAEGFNALRQFKVQEFKETLAVQVVPDGGVKKAALSSRYKRCRARTLSTNSFKVFKPSNPPYPFAATGLRSAAIRLSLRLADHAFSRLYTDGRRRKRIGRSTIPRRRRYVTHRHYGAETAQAAPPPERSLPRSCQ